MTKYREYAGELQKCIDILYEIKPRVEFMDIESEILSCFIDRLDTINDIAVTEEDKDLLFGRLVVDITTRHLIKVLNTIREEFINGEL